MYMSTEQGIDASLYERNVAYTDASLNMSKARVQVRLYVQKNLRLCSRLTAHVYRTGYRCVAVYEEN
jgi:hypothetical protein